MKLKSCLYECKVTHVRVSPKRHVVKHSTFMFCVDLDEMKSNAASKLLGWNRSALYTCWNKDHFERNPEPIIDKLKRQLLQNGASSCEEIERVLMLTNFGFLNYVFNPITVFYCFDTADTLLCALAEVGNTFGEKKVYLVDRHRNAKSDILSATHSKEFYVSPFINLDSRFEFSLTNPKRDDLHVNVTSKNDNETALVANLTGKKLELNDRNLLLMTLKYPFATYLVILMIHVHALVLWLRGVPFIRKEDSPELQTGVIHPQ